MPTRKIPEDSDSDNSNFEDLTLTADGTRSPKKGKTPQVTPQYKPKTFHFSMADIVKIHTATLDDDNSSAKERSKKREVPTGPRKRAVKGGLSESGEIEVTIHKLADPAKSLTKDAGGLKKPGMPRIGKDATSPKKGKGVGSPQASSLHSTAKLDEAISVDPRVVGAWRIRGELRCANKDFPGAIQDYTNAITLSHGSNEYDFYNRAWALLENGEVEAAIKDCDKSLELNSSLASSWGRRAICKLRAKDYDGTIQDCTASLRIDHRNAQMWQCKSTAKLMQGNIGGAVEDASEAIYQDSRYAPAYVARAESRLDLEDFAGVVADCDKSIRLDAKQAPAWSCRAAAKIALGDFADAAADATQAIHLDKKLASAWERRGEAKCRMLDYNGAIEDCARATLIDQDSLKAWCFGAKAKFQKGYYSECISDCRAALRSDPTCEMAIDFLEKATSQKKYKGVWKLPILEEWKRPPPAILQEKDPSTSTSRWTLRKSAPNLRKENILALTY